MSRVNAFSSALTVPVILTPPLWIECVDGICGPFFHKSIETKLNQALIILLTWGWIKRFYQFWCHYGQRYVIIGKFFKMLFWHIATQPHSRVSNIPKLAKIDLISLRSPYLSYLTWFLWFSCYYGQKHLSKGKFFKKDSTIAIGIFQSNVKTSCMY